MKINTHHIENEAARRLAKATIEQFAYRVGEDKEHLMLSENGFYDFYISLNIPENLKKGLFLSKKKNPFDLPKEHMQHYEVRRPSPMVDLDIYPRGIIVSSNLERDISRSLHRDISYRIKAEAIRFNKRYGPKIAPLFKKQGKHIFPSEISYLKMLRDKEVADILVASAERQEPYFGFIRVDYNSLRPRNNKPGWLLPKEVEWLKPLPVIIIPGITEEQLRILEKKEKKALGLE